MKSTTLYDLEDAELEAVFSPDGLKIDLPNGLAIILRADLELAPAHNGRSPLAARINADEHISTRKGQAAAAVGRSRNGSERKTWPCPMKNCLETFKGIGWRNKHLKRVHGVEPPPS